MSYNDPKRSQRPLTQASEPAIRSERAMFPGKRTLTMSLPQRPAGSPAAVQQKRASVDELVGRERAELSTRWMATAMRPDVHPPPVQQRCTPAATSQSLPVSVIDDAQPALSGPSFSTDAMVQMRTGSTQPAHEAHQLAAQGISGTAVALPHLDRIQRAFGPYDVSKTRAHIGGPAAYANQAMGAEAYATGDHAAFRSTPDVHTAAHEAAHIVQQRAGVQLGRGVGRSGDAYEQHADAVADAVVAGRSAAVLLAGASEPSAGISEPGPDACPQCGQALASGREACPACRATAGALQAIQLQPQSAPNAACRGTDRLAGPEHEAIQNDYIQHVDSSGAREYAIPGGSSGGNTGYADLVSLSTHALYEIKPYNPAAIAAGMVQVTQYLNAARQSCNPSAPWHLGMTYPARVIPFGSRQLVAQQYGHPGLILYYVRQTARPRLQVNWDTVAQVLFGLGLSLLLIPTIIAALADPEPASKLALAGLSVAMIAAILEAFGIEQSESVPPSA